MTSGWRKSSRSGMVNDNACVEVAALGDAIGIRDSKMPAGGHLSVDRAGFAVLVRRIKRGAFDGPGTG
jgi:hypothetical protein